MTGPRPWSSERRLTEAGPMPLTLYTDTSVIHGIARTRHRRVTDVLNDAERPFVVLDAVEMTDIVGSSRTIQAAYAQVNLDAVLFAVSSAPVELVPELRTPKVPERAFISLPPFRVVGRIHLRSGETLHEGLGELVGRFLPVTDAVYWSESLDMERTGALMVAVNHGRAQILCPFEEVVPVDDIRRRIGAGDSD